jgi:hypothetical protein
MEYIEPESPAARRLVDVNSPAVAALPLGCWLVTPRCGFTHHGIYVGDGKVVHYAGLSRLWRPGPVEVVSLSQFSMGRRLWVKRTPTARYSGASAALRALSRVGEDGYQVMTSNCEHFCAWCLDGVGRSSQVEQWVMWPWAIVLSMLIELARWFTVRTQRLGMPQ